HLTRGDGAPLAPASSGEIESAAKRCKTRHCVSARAAKLLDELLDPDPRLRSRPDACPCNRRLRLDREIESGVRFILLKLDGGEPLADGSGPARRAAAQGWPRRLCNRNLS